MLLIFIVIRIISWLTICGWIRGNMLQAFSCFLSLRNFVLRLRPPFLVQRHLQMLDFYFDLNDINTKTVTRLVTNLREFTSLLNKLSNSTLQFDKISYKLVSHNKEETEEGLKMYLQILSANSCSDIQWLVADKMFSFTLIDDLSDWLVRIWPPSSSCRSGSGNSSSRELSSIVCLQKRMCEWVRSGIYF